MTTDRRTVLQAGLTLTAASAARAGSVPALAQAHACEIPSVGGEFRCDDAVLAAAADDFGHLVHERPRAVFKPASAADIAELVRWAGSAGRKVAARGQGHSIYGRSMADDGIVIDMTTMNTVYRIEADRVVVDAGATWGALLDATLRRGLAPPVLTNYLDLSVGGTLAVGGIGGMTSRYGFQTDNILELQVVTGDGRELACSNDMNSDLFDAVRAGLGQCGIVTRATLRLMPAPERVRRFHLSYPDLHLLTAEQRTVLADARFDHLQGALLPDGTGGWKYQLEGVVFYQGDAPPDDSDVLAGLSDIREAAEIADLTYREDVGAFARLEQLLRSNAQWFNPHPWLLTFLRGSNAEQVAGEIVAGSTNDGVGPFGRISYYPILTSAVRTPLARLPDESVVFPFNVVRIPASGDRGRAEQMIAENRTLYDRIRKAGGLLYPVSAFPMSTDDWKEHFGPRWSLLLDAKRHFDPHRLLTPGYNVL